MVRELGARILGLRLATVPSLLEVDEASRREPPTCTGADDDLVPVSVRLGEVVPPEDPEDWTRPLTWVAAAGMLAAPLAGAGLVLLGGARPTPGRPSPARWLVAVVLAGGAALAGAHAAGARLRAFTGTIAAGLFGRARRRSRSGVVAGERQVGVGLADPGARARQRRPPAWPARSPRCWRSTRLAARRRFRLAARLVGAASALLWSLSASLPGLFRG